MKDEAVFYSGIEFGNDVLDIDTRVEVLVNDFSASCRFMSGISFGIEGVIAGGLVLGNNFCVGIAAFPMQLYEIGFRLLIFIIIFFLVQGFTGVGSIFLPGFFH